MPKVSVLMPLFNGKAFIEESIQSIQKQTYTDWEFIIVNDFGSNDGCADIVKRYAKKDPRIVLLQAQERLGLAASLNMGLDVAKGEYVARVDVDDPSEPQRLEKQVAYLDEHPEIVLCSCWQKSVTPTASVVQEAPCDPEELRAAMMFGCEISHCGVMLRKKEFDKNNWRYDPAFLGEDFELWGRILSTGAKMANIPEVLVSHRWGFENVSLSKGEKLREEVRELSMHTVAQLGVHVEKYTSFLFSGWKQLPKEYAENCKEVFLKQGYQLLQEIVKKNEALHQYDPEILDKLVYRRWDWIRKSCGLNFKEYPYHHGQASEKAPVVSVVLPTYCSTNDISRSIDSVIDQSFQDWELLVINDFGSDDGTAELVKMYGMFDQRIRLIQAEERLGLAESINCGMKLARGKYIARLDADDTAHVERFQKQVDLMERRPEVGLCGTWQHHYGPSTDWVHEATADENLLKARLIFWCDLCHSTLMMRRDVFIEHNLFYDNTYLAEDYELWTRAMKYMTIVNIPEVLGEYKEDGTSITAKKFQGLHRESGRISAKVLYENLNIELSEDEAMLLNGWKNPFEDRASRIQALQKLEPIFREIWKRNAAIGVFQPDALLQVLAAKWYWIQSDIDWKAYKFNLSSIEDIFNNRARPTLAKRYQNFKRNNPKLSVRIRKILKKWLFKPIAALYRKFLRWSFAWIIDEEQRSIERWTWDRYQRSRDDAEHMQQSLTKEVAAIAEGKNSISYIQGSKIRALFVFQVASFWPAQESVYAQLLSDERFDVKLVCYDDDFDKSIKTETALEYLKCRGYDFTHWKEFDIDDFNPHVVFLQTAYDTNRKAPYTSAALNARGRKVVYIPYGIEIADTVHARRDHFLLPIMDNAWRVYTISETMRQEYLIHLRKQVCVRALGLPRFDALYHKEKFSPNEEILQRAGGRKIILWKVHFPKVIEEFGKKILVTPDIQHYLAFAGMVGQMSDLFFVFMPHPRFREFNDDELVKEQTIQLMKILSHKENVYIDDQDDYRSSLFMADAIIVDRSAVMIEAAAVGVPVLYMYNEKYEEPMTAAIKPLVDSYYQGIDCQSMVDFIEQFRRQEDPKKAEREAAFKLCVPFYDGLCSQRIADDIASGIMASSDTNDLDCRLRKLEKQTEQILENQKKIEALMVEIAKTNEK